MPLASLGSSTCSQIATRWPAAIELAEIVGRGLDRDAGERHSIAARGQGDVEDPRGELGVVEEHLVEVAHAEKENRVPVTGLDLPVLLHERGAAAGSAARPVTVPLPRRASRRASARICAAAACALGPVGIGTSSHLEQGPVLHDVGGEAAPLRSARNLVGRGLGVHRADLHREAGAPGVDPAGAGRGGRWGPAVGRRVHTDGRYGGAPLQRPLR